MILLPISIKKNIFFLLHTFFFCSSLSLTSHQCASSGDDTKSTHIWNLDACVWTTFVVIVCVHAILRHPYCIHLRIATEISIAWIKFRSTQAFQHLFNRRSLPFFHQISQLLFETIKKNSKAMCIFISWI